MVFRKFIFFSHRFAIDISFSAVSLSYLLAIIFGIEIEPFFLLLLFFCTNATYNFDRFFDNFREEKIREKKNFSITNSYLLFFLADLFLIVTTIIFKIERLKYFNDWQIYAIAAQAVVLACYFLILHKKPKLLGYSKEITVALLFSFGCFLPIFLSDFSSAWSSLNHYPTTYVGFFFTLFHNTLLFSFFNYEKDKERKQMSLITILPREQSEKLFVLLGLLALIFLLSYPPPNQAGNYRYYLPIALAIQGLLFRLFIRRTENPNDHQKNLHFTFACLGDGYFIPLLVIFLLIF